MTDHKTRHILKDAGLLLALIMPAMLLLPGCNAESDLEPRQYNNGDTVDAICISVARRGVSEQVVEDNKTQEVDENYDYKDYSINDLIPYDINFDGNSIIQISQQTQYRDPFRDEDDIFNFRFMNTPEAKAATWDDEESFNFEAYRHKIPLDWKYIGDNQSYKGGFALYGLYFPLENQLRRRKLDNGTIYYSVMEDQSTLENLKKSDILGAYHSTSHLYDRIRFKLHHLMTYVRIRLYVPLYDDVRNTGYREGALLKATIDNVNPEFSFNWEALITPDDNGPSVSPVKGEGEIIMYQHPLPEGETKHRIVKLPYRKFISSDYYDQGLDSDYDYVRVYDFSVLIPYQYGEYQEDGKEHNFTETNFLNFYLRTNAGAQTKYYFNQAFFNDYVPSDEEKANGEVEEENSLEMQQGVFQYLQLYVPRVGQQLVYMGAKITPWGQLGSSMLLEEPEEED